ncbi:MAG: hypothetical protein MI919_37635 [Holophagales bacterium]|nr:hypothetical protein [Holophagales bacterium]
MAGRSEGTLFLDQVEDADLFVGVAHDQSQPEAAGAADLVGVAIGV